MIVDVDGKTLFDRKSYIDAISPEMSVLTVGLALVHMISDEFSKVADDLTHTLADNAGGRCM